MFDIHFIRWDTDRANRNGACRSIDVGEGQGARKRRGRGARRRRSPCYAKGRDCCRHRRARHQGVIHPDTHQAASELQESRIRERRDEWDNLRRLVVIDFTDKSRPRPQHHWAKDAREPIDLRLRGHPQMLKVSPCQNKLGNFTAVELVE